ncbi:MAG: PH domain-containing protein [Oscillospiraceae bacterium]|nr:PH domain-containing protein [Oscillospiraceae bacterium]
MEFILYFILRRFFVSFREDTDCFTLRKGLMLRRVYHIPRSAVICAETKRTPLLRLLKGQKVTLCTLSGQVSFYLRNSEKFEIRISPVIYKTIRPKFRTVLLSSFSRTKALGGTAVFAVTISRIGSVFGSDYYDKIIITISQTAEDLREMLESLRIAVPQIAAIATVFVGVAWIFSFMRSILRFCRFRISLGRGYACVRHGFVTLYEEVFVPDHLGTVIARDTPSTLLFKAAPLYLYNRMILPALSKKKRSSVLRTFLGITPPDSLSFSPPKRALLGHIAVPSGWGGAAAVLLVLCYLNNAAPILRTVLWGVVLLSLWHCITFAAYMKRTGISNDKHIAAACARKSGALLTVYIHPGSEAYRRIDRNPFQKRSGMCDLRLFYRSGFKLRLRNMQASDISEP